MISHASLPLLPAFLAALALAPAGGESDEAGAAWPQYHGPHGDRTIAATLDAAWPEDGPAVDWKVPTPAGFSSFSVAGGRAFTLIGRGEGNGMREVCVALDAASGREIWRTPLSSLSYDGGGEAGAGDNTGGDGPRSTPSISGDRVYVLDSALLLACLDASTGRTLWKHDLMAEHAGRSIRWQNAASPLVDDGRVFVAGGGRGQSLLAFDARSGAVLWKTGDEMITHATPIAATLADVRQVIWFLQSGLVATEPSTGEELWRAEFPYRVSTAASPVVFEDIVYCSAGYGVGAGAFKVTLDDATFKAEPLWRQRNKLINHWSTPVCKDGFLYGMFSFKEYGAGPLMCVDIRDGETRWSRDGFGPGNCILVGSRIVALSDAGEVVLADATPDAYRETARSDVLDGKCWSSPAYADGDLFVRSTVEGARLGM